MYKEALLGSLLTFLATSLIAGPADNLQQEELTLENGTRLTVVQNDDRILGIIVGSKLFVSEEQQLVKQAHKPHDIATHKGHLPQRLEKAPPLPDYVPSEVRSKLQSWRILDDAGNVMDTIFCTDQGCSVGGYSYITQN